MRNGCFIFFIGCAAALFFVALPAYAAELGGRVNEAFLGVFGRNPTPQENSYWLDRVAKGEKRTFAELQGAMFYHQALGKTVGSAPQRTAGPAAQKQDNKQQMIKDVLLLFIEIYGSDPASAEKAWWRKRISCGEIKTQAQLTSSMKFHKAKGVGKGSDSICGGPSTGSGSSGVTRRSVAGIGTHPMGDQVKIGIYKTDGRAIHVTADGEYQIREGGSQILATLGKDDIVQVSWSGGKYHVRGSGLELDTEREVRLVPLKQAIVQIKSYSDPSKTIPGKNYNRFRGVVEIRRCAGCSELWAINELRTEYYLRGLAETSDSGPQEYLKAIAVAARTYVLHHKVVNNGRFPKQGFHIGSTSDDQIYRGYEYEIITPRLSSSFATTKGIVVTDGEGDAPLPTVYFSDSDGRTRSAKEAWGTERFEHLQHSVRDPHHVASSCIGHCVGMSAQGAYGFAKNDDWSFQRILKYYYKGISLVKAY